MKIALTIAGSDSSAGAGIQADIKTMTLNGVYAESAITALTAQNTTGVYDILESSPEFLKAQLDAIFDDIYPDSVKIGMVSSKALIEVIADCLKERKTKNIVVDPVMVATSGSKLLLDDSIETLMQKLLPLADLLTPNIPEAEILSGIEIKSIYDMEDAAKIISEKFSCKTLIKGGHKLNDANDYLYSEGKGVWFKGERIDNPNTHGTGCTLSSAIAANLSKGFSMEEAIKMAKDFLSAALKDGLNLGKGSGPMNHAFDIKDKYKKLGENR
ncbi:bifunctional hydroxymethylpyrimidine kinase/phosphomethylpyrimidine kinase [Anaerococcus sp. AGMB00486]|uniref:Hydroxymethylpyrimidine/phosphomethylpyrimidine kinase n=1 Tax=Anaerococcus faecalis TaxID=2742993 RepID=A0ABX2NBQ1_9FIRM|nr:bifunctional hydroxymethylpyrimidine kinase/phosphomethylpyrimidine kinase [Anaerococcus faecalis]NVF12122.1 bifunctional hydroxymethylpyrimidine kinase/phosphomethylpyrimidine kinase [Anaerococcus faecalis]